MLQIHPLFLYWDLLRTKSLFWRIDTALTFPLQNGYDRVLQITASQCMHSETIFTFWSKYLGWGINVYNFFILFSHAREQKCRCHLRLPEYIFSLGGLVGGVYWYANVSFLMIECITFHPNMLICDEWSVELSWWSDCFLLRLIFTMVSLWR